jgi:hypothetical protein
LGGEGGCPPRAGGAAEELVEVPGDGLGRVAVVGDGVVPVELGRVVVGRVLVPVEVGRVLVPVEVVAVDVGLVVVPVAVIVVGVVDVSVPVVEVSVPVVDVSVAVVVVSVWAAVVVSAGLPAARATPVWGPVAISQIPAITIVASNRRRGRRVTRQWKSIAAHYPPGRAPSPRRGRCLTAPGDDQSPG